LYSRQPADLLGENVDQRPNLRNAGALRRDQHIGLDRRRRVGRQNGDEPAGLRGAAS
jgi:hypothetical protein